MLRSLVRKDPPDLAILIDYAEFNMMLARSTRRAGVPVLYYITPQVWAWRRGRIRKLGARTDQMAVVFPFEADLFTLRGRPRELRRPSAPRSRRSGAGTSRDLIAA